MTETRMAMHRLICCLAMANVLRASPVTSYGSYNGAASQARSADSAFAFKLPQAPENDQSSDLASQVSSLSNTGRSYGVGVLPADKDAIVYPDQIIRDSYGNIAMPYIPLSPDKQLPGSGQGVGFLTNINKDQTHHTPSSATDKVPWVLPSYAGGILQTNVPLAKPQLDLLPPPLSSGNFNFPSIPSIPSVPYASSKPDGVPNSKEDSYNNEVTHGQGNSNYDSSREPGSHFVPNQAQHQTSHAGIPSINAQNGNYNNNNLVSSQSTTERSEYEKNYTHGKYHGGFGGAPGVLGDQTEPGYAVNNDQTHSGLGESNNAVSPHSRPAVIDLSNNPTRIEPKPSATSAAPSKYGGGSSYGGADPQISNTPKQNQNGPIPSLDTHSPHDNPINNGHIGSNSNPSVSSNIPQPNLDLVAPGFSEPSSEIKPPQYTYNPNLGSYGGNSPNSGGSHPTSHETSPSNYPQNGATNGKPPTSSIDSVLGNQNQPGYAVGGSNPPASVPSNYGVSRFPASSHNPSHEPSPSNYPQNGGSSSHGSEDSILGNQNQPGYAVSGSAPSLKPNDNRPSNYNGGVSAGGSQPPSFGSNTLNNPQTGGTANQGLIDSILGNQNQPGFAVGESGAHKPSHVGAPSSGQPGIQSSSHNQELLDSILGNQKQPGFAVSGSSAPSLQGPFVSSHNPSGSSNPTGEHHDAATPNKDKYTGGFGGPPGALTPHDNSSGSLSTVSKPLPANGYAGPNRKY